MARVGLKELANSLGIDVSTVSRALRDDKRVKPETRERVRMVAEKLDYRPHALARALKGGRTGRVAVLLSPPQQRFASPVFLELLSTLSQRLSDINMSLTVFAPRDRSEEPDIVRAIVEDRLADGIILGRTLLQDDRVDYLLSAGFPFVTFGRTAHEDEHSWVEIDYRVAGAIAVSALMQHDPGSLTIISAWEGQRFADNYVAGARHKAESMGLAGVRVERIDMTESGGETLASAILIPRGRQALACIQDSVAFGVLRASVPLGLAAGVDFSLFGGQNFPGAEHTAPPLSTFSTRDSDVAELLSSIMIDRLTADGNHTPRHHVIEPEALLRQSHMLEPAGSV